MFVIMESSLYEQKKSRRNKTGLLPNYFKKIGLAIVVLAIVSGLLIKVMDIGLAAAQKETFRLLLLNFFILGLLFIAWAKDKEEDEMTIALRLKSMGFTFIWAVLLVICKPLIDMLFKEPAEELSAQGLVLSMLFFYLFLFFLQKKGR